MSDGHVTVSVDLPGGPLRLRQPEQWAELPDDGAVEWAPLAPYWSVLWRSGVALAGALDLDALAQARVAELGCGLGVPSLAAARAGATVVATDRDPEALALLERNAALNGVRLETALVEWDEPEALLAKGPFDLVLAGDVLYEDSAVASLLALLPQLAGESMLADPGRPAAAVFLDAAAGRWTIDTRRSGVVAIHRLSRAGSPIGRSRPGP